MFIGTWKSNEIEDRIVGKKVELGCPWVWASIGF
jgi:hypothetical protein